MDSSKLTQYFPPAPQFLMSPLLTQQLAPASLNPPLVSQSSASSYSSSSSQEAQKPLKTGIDNASNRLKKNEREKGRRSSVSDLYTSLANALGMDVNKFSKIELLTAAQRCLILHQSSTGSEAAGAAADDI